MTDGLKDEYREELIRILSANPRVERIVLFGSRAMETFTPTSDIDLALFGDELTLTDLANLADEIAETTIPQKVDLVLWNSIERPELKRHIREAGVEWWKKINPSVFKKEKHSWRSGQLGEFINLQRGYDLPQKKRSSGNIPIISSSGESGCHTEAKVRAPGVITGRYGTLGKVFFIEKDFWPLNTTLWVSDFKGNDPKFISYFLKTIDFSSCSDKAAVPGVNRNHLHQLHVQIPPLPIQKEIAHILGTLDDKIELNKKMNATLEAMAQAIFKSWFVDFDPVHAKAEGRMPVGMDKETADLFPSEFEESELGLIPKGWNVKKIGDILELAYGKALPASERFPGNVPVYGSGGITGWHHKKLVSGPGIIIGRKGTVGSIYFENDDFFPIDTVFYTKTKQSIPIQFIYHQLLNLNIASMGADSAVPGVNRNTIYSQKIILPSNDVLENYSVTLISMTELKLSLLKENSYLFQVLEKSLSEMMSGKCVLSHGKDTADGFE